MGELHSRMTVTVKRVGKPKDKLIDVTDGTKMFFKRLLKTNGVRNLRDNNKGLVSVSLKLQKKRIWSRKTM